MYVGRCRAQHHKTLLPSFVVQGREQTKHFLLLRQGANHLSIKGTNTNRHTLYVSPFMTDECPLRFYDVVSGIEETSYSRTMEERFRHERIIAATCGTLIRSCENIA